jgi:hypothetical protein
MVGVVPDKVENGRSEGSLNACVRNSLVRSHVTFLTSPITCHVPLDRVHLFPPQYPSLLILLVIFHFGLDSHRVKSLSHHHFHHILHARPTPRLTLSHHRPASRTCFRPDTHLNVNHHQNDTLRDEHCCLPPNRAGCALE